MWVVHSWRITAYGKFLYQEQLTKTLDKDQKFMNQLRKSITKELINVATHQSLARIMNMVFEMEIFMYLLKNTFFLFYGTVTRI